MNDSSTSDFKYLPSVDTLLQASDISKTAELYGHDSVVEEARSILDDWRNKILENDEQAKKQIQDKDFLEFLCTQICKAVELKYQSSMVPVFNLTGTVIHTNLGRSPFPDSAISAMVQAASQPVNLEFDLETGKRGDRDKHLETIICNITGAEAATVVNNNAAAVLLTLTTLAVGKDVLISRGELVEIGGSFRIPEVMGSAGCKLKEVGTTNRTHLADFEKAIDSDTALIMQVHSSNYEIKGFTMSVELKELSLLAEKHDLPLAADLGSGTLVDLVQFGLPGEPTVSQSLEAGADLVMFSGDKLLGGPQAGIIVGKEKYIRQLKSNPLKRALRIDKVKTAALLEVFLLYKSPRQLTERLPILEDLTRSLDDINRVAEKVLPELKKQLDGKANITIEPCQSQIGSGALPTDLIDSCALVIEPIAAKGGRDASLQKLALAFRKLPKPVIGRIQDGRLLFDLRCLHDSDEFCKLLGQLDF